MARRGEDIHPYMAVTVFFRLHYTTVSHPSLSQTLRLNED